MSNPNDSETDRIVNAVQEIVTATRCVHEAEDVVTSAHKRKDDAINRLNQAQRRLDELVLGMKKAAPRDSEWHLQQHTHRVAAG